MSWFFPAGGQWEGDGHLRVTTNVLWFPVMWTSSVYCPSGMKKVFILSCVWEICCSLKRIWVPFFLQKLIPDRVREWPRLSGTRCCGLIYQVINEQGVCVCLCFCVFLWTDSRLSPSNNVRDGSRLFHVLSPTVCYSTRALFTGQERW